MFHTPRLTRLATDLGQGITVRLLARGKVGLILRSTLIRSLGDSTTGQTQTSGPSRSLNRVSTTRALLNMWNDREMTSPFSRLSITSSRSSTKSPSIAPLSDRSGDKLSDCFYEGGQHLLPVARHAVGRLPEDVGVRVPVYDYYVP